MLQSIGGSGEQARANGKEMKNTTVLSFFFSLFTRLCASSPDQPRQQKPVCRFPIDHLSPLFSGSTKGAAYFSRMDVDLIFTSLPLSIHMYVYTCSRQLEGRKSAFMK